VTLVLDTSDTLVLDSSDTIVLDTSDTFVLASSDTGASSEFAQVIWSSVIQSLYDKCPVCIKYDNDNLNQKQICILVLGLFNLSAHHMYIALDIQKHFSL
jgi:hypothetical protein